ncbi:hypothetical protein OPV22_000694 [Ensete ventricosum]|uniref:Pentacotripeptide-repeat region of PRORP domain-containing protein n=1 Tax=Ensete ventricosum TaxID=4639 RepID=A0AAV8QBH1_ENSVE|nr:hypothetical protein OPV22_000694 [Ensete ventricosum]
MFARRLSSTNSSFVFLKPLVLPPDHHLTTLAATLPPDLHSQLARFCSLLKRRRYVAAKSLLKSLVTADGLAHPFPSLAPAVEASCRAAVVPYDGALNMLFRVYSDAGMTDRALDAFELLLGRFGRVEERSCTIYLQALRRSNSCSKSAKFELSMD